VAVPPVRRCDGGTLGQASQLAPFTATFSWRRIGAVFAGLRWFGLR
jgi:hypothetical protein